ncbi:MAG: TolC family protein [Gammaproteobacteria bacterium]|nr:TolC family protein [Gammaproteobacteria bacterium]
MTQVAVGLSQAFPPGDTRSLARRKAEERRAMSPVERGRRVARLTMRITQIWLDARLATKTIALIESDRHLFEQLVDVTRSSYRSATRRVNQQDLIRAQVELTRLDERILRLKERRERRLEQLGQWVPEDLLEASMDWSLPPASDDRGGADLVAHPEVRLLDQQIDVGRTELELARETRRPGWTLSAGYAWRDEDFTGRDLPDFLTVGVSMDLPLFSGNRQDKRIAAAADRVASRQSDRLLKLRELRSRYEDASASIARLQDQLQLYNDALLGQMAALAPVGAGCLYV